MITAVEVVMDGGVPNSVVKIFGDQCEINAPSVLPALCSEVPVSPFTYIWIQRSEGIDEARF